MQRIGTIVSRALQHLAPHHHGRMRNAVTEHQEPSNNRWIRRDGPGRAWRSMLVNVLNPGAEHANFSMRFEKSKLFLKSGGQADVVGIHSRNVAALRDPATSIKRRDQAAVFLRVKLDAIIASGVLTKDSAAIVGRSVIHDDELEIPERLIQDAFDRLADNGRCIVDGHDHRNPRRIRHTSDVYNTCRMARDFVIRMKFDGLGDHLFYSHLPRIAKQYGGYDRVFISNLSECRHPDYRRIIWESNPFVDGFCGADAPLYDFEDIPPGMNILDKHMLLTGLDDGQRFHEPELYLKPRIIESLRNATVFDPNFVSYVGAVKPRHVQKFLSRESIFPEYMLAPRDKNVAVKRYGELLVSTSLEHYC